MLAVYFVRKSDALVFGILVNVEELANRCRPLTREEELDAFRRWRAGESEAGNEIVFSVSRLVLKLARRFRVRADQQFFEELVSYGLDGVFQAMRKFDPSLGNRFSTYAVPWVRQRFQACLQDSLSSMGPKFSAAVLTRCSLHENTAFVQPDESCEMREATAVVLQNVPELPPLHRKVTSGRLAGKPFHRIGIDLGYTKQRMQQVYAESVKMLGDKLWQA